MPRFWQNSPRGFEMGPSRLTLLLWPEKGFWPRTQLAHDTDTYQFEGGRHKTAEMLLWFGPQRDAAGDIYRAVEAPLFARAPTSWYSDTGAVWPLAPAGLEAKSPELKEAMGRYDRLQVAKVDERAADPAVSFGAGTGDRWGKVTIPKLWEDNPDVFCGWMNYGDLIWGHGYCSLYYDWPYSMLMQYLRLGNREFLDVALDMCRHRQDIDQYHVGNTAPYLGWFQRYEKGMHGFIERQHQNPQWEKNPAPSHTWNRGPLLNWALTGDPRSLETAVENGEAYHRFFYGQHKLGSKDKIPWGEFRTPAWAMENWMALYEYTGDRKYLDWANEVFTKTLLAMERDNGSCGHIVKDGRQSAQFTCYIVEPVTRLHNTTGREDAAGFLMRVLDWQRVRGTMHGVEKDGKYLPLLWVEDWGQPPSEDETEVNLGAGNAYGIPMLDGYAYLYSVYGRKKDMEFARRLFIESVFYFGLGNGAGRSDRTPLGYHYLGSPLGSTPKIHAWTGRYCQLYLLTEEQCGNAKSVGASSK